MDIQDEDRNSFIHWLQTFDGVYFCVTNMEVYYDLLGRGLGDAQRLATDPGLQDGVNLFLLDAEDAQAFDRRTFVHVPTTSVHLAKLEHEARARLAKVVTAKTAVHDAAVTWAAADRDAGHEPIPNRHVHLFLNWLKGRKGRRWRNKYRDATDFEGLPWGLDSVNRLDGPVLRQQVERLFRNAVSDTSCSFFRPADTDDEVSTDDSIVTAGDYAERLDAKQELRKDAEDALSRRNHALTKQRWAEEQVKIFVAMAHAPAAGERAAAVPAAVAAAALVPLPLEDNDEDDDDVVLKLAATDDILHPAVQHNVFPPPAAVATTFPKTVAGVAAVASAAPKSGEDDDDDDSPKKKKHGKNIWRKK